MRMLSGMMHANADIVNIQKQRDSMVQKKLEGLSASGKKIGSTGSFVSEADGPTKETSFSETARLITKSASPAASINTSDISKATDEKTKLIQKETLETVRIRSFPTVFNYIY
jgi:hypothetical protein